MPVQAPVVACLGCCNRIPQTESLQQQKFVFLPIWRLGNPRSRCQLTQFPWEPSSWPAEAPSPLCLFPLHRRPQSHQIRAPPWWPHFTLIASRRYLRTRGGGWGLRPQHGFGEGTVQCVAVPELPPPPPGILRNPMFNSFQTGFARPFLETFFRCLLPCSVS